MIKYWLTYLPFVFAVKYPIFLCFFLLKRTPTSCFRLGQVAQEVVRALKKEVGSSWKIFLLRRMGWISSDIFVGNGKLRPGKNKNQGFSCEFYTPQKNNWNTWNPKLAKEGAYFLPLNKMCNKHHHQRHFVSRQLATTNYNQITLAGLAKVHYTVDEKQRQCVLIEVELRHEMLGEVRWNGRLHREASWSPNWTSQNW